jgi:CubicO group peptidase (beta-lactamase class C family)
MSSDDAAIEPPGLDATAVRSALAYYDTWLAYQQRYQRVPGVQAAVRLGDEVLLDTAHGLADLEAATPLTTRHLFRIASHSKTFTATTVMRLVQRGELRLDDPAGQWVPWLGAGGSPFADVTIRELLGHVSGMSRDSGDGDHWQLHRLFPDADTLRAKILEDGAKVLPRNDRFKYSNLGYSLLGLVIETVTGTLYGDAVRAAVVEPLGLRDTGPELEPSRLADLAVGYSALAYADTRVPIEHVDTRAMAAATGFYSTARDLVDYLAAHFLGDDRLLDDDAKRQLQHGAWDVGGDKGKYALGFSVETIGKRRVIGHGGGYPGHITRSVADPRAGLAVSVLTNAIDGPAQSLAHAAVRLIDLACAQAPAQTPAAAPHVDLTRFGGRFASLWGVLDVACLGRRLYALDPSGDDPADQPDALEVVDATTLRFAGANGYGSFGEPLRYEFAADGAVRSLRAGSMTYLPLDDFRLPAQVTLG